MKFPRLGSPTQAAIEHYNLFHPDFAASLSGEDRLLIDLECLSEYNKMEIEAQNKARKDSEFSKSYPGAEPFPDQETRWARAMAATKKVD